MKNIFELVKKYSAKKLELLAIFLGFILLIAPSITIVSSDYVLKSSNSVSEVRDLGWVTIANSSGEINVSRSFNSTTEGGGGRMFFSHNFTLYNTWSLNFSAGAYLPVNLTVVYPSNVSAGENLSILIGLDSLLGYVFLNLEGEHSLELYNSFYGLLNVTGTYFEHYYNMVLKVLNYYALNWLVDLETPIGFVNLTYEDIAQFIGSFSISLDLEYYNPMENTTKTKNITLDASVDVYLTFDVTIIANTSVVGLVNVTGTALENPMTYELIWGSEGWKNVTVPIREDASSNDTLNVGVELKYVVHEFKIIYSNISLLIDVNNSSIDEVIGGFVNDTLMRQNIRDRIYHVINNYINGSMELPCRVKETKLREKPRLLAEENEIVSSSPYSEYVALSTKTTIGIVSEEGTEAPTTTPPQPFGLESGLLIASILAAVVVGVYLLIRKNRQ